MDKKTNYIDAIIDDLRDNIWESQEFILDCTAGFLETMTLDELKEFYVIPTLINNAEETT